MKVVIFAQNTNAVVELKKFFGVTEGIGKNEVIEIIVPENFKIPKEYVLTFTRYEIIRIVELFLPINHNNDVLIISKDIFSGDIRIGNSLGIQCWFDDFDF